MTMTPRRTRSVALVFFAPPALPWRSPGGPEAQLKAAARRRLSSSTSDRTAYEAGSPARVAALVTIEHGWHVNSHKPSFEYLIPTVLDLTLPPGWPQETVAVSGGEDEDLLLRAQAARRLRRRRGDAGRGPAAEGGEEGGLPDQRLAALPGLQRLAVPAAGDRRGADRAHGRARRPAAARRALRQGREPPGASRGGAARGRRRPWRALRRSPPATSASCCCSPCSAG